MQGTICFNSLLYPKTKHSRSIRKLADFKRRGLSLSISAVAQNVATPEAQDALKRALAKKAVGLVKPGMVVGLGTGSTASLAIEELGRLIKQGKLKDVVAVGANYQSRVLARQFGVKTVDLNDINIIDIAFDGVDEVDFNKNLLKGGGAAHTMQKVVDSFAKECVILADQSKVVLQLGSTFPVPVEVLPAAISPVLRRLITLGGAFLMAFQIHLEMKINMIPGVVENGIVSGIATSVLVAVQDGDSVTVLDLEEFVKLILSNKRMKLDGQKRVHLIEGIAQGLLYLDEYSREKVIHRDLKANNILLDGVIMVIRLMIQKDNSKNFSLIYGTTSGGR